MSKYFSGIHPDIYKLPVGISFNAKRSTGHFDIKWTLIGKVEPGLFMYILRPMKIGENILRTVERSTYITINGVLLPTDRDLQTGDRVPEGRLTLMQHIFRSGMYEDFEEWMYST